MRRKIKSERKSDLEIKNAQEDETRLTLVIRLISMAMAGKKAGYIRDDATPEGKEGKLDSPPSVALTSSKSQCSPRSPVIQRRREMFFCS